MDNSVLRQKGLEKLAAHHDFADEDLILLGRILDLENHPDVVHVWPTGTFSEAGLTSYEVILKYHIKKQDIERMMIEREFPEYRRERGNWNDHDLSTMLIYDIRRQPRYTGETLCRFGLRFTRT